MCRTIISLAILTLLAACQDEKPGFTQIGYFKGENRNRVFILKADEPVNAVQSRQMAENLMSSDGRYTTAYIFETGTKPADHVSLAEDYPSANLAMFEKPGPNWRWRFIQSPGGQITFTDCNETATPDACRQ